MKSRISAAIIILGLVTILRSSFGAGSQILTGHVPKAIARLHLRPIGLLPETNQMRLSIGLPFRNLPELTNLLQQIYDPVSPNYHHFLTPAQFTERFGPSEQDYEAVAAFARTNGLIVGESDPGRTMVHVLGSVADINRIFHVHMTRYRHPTEARDFYAPDTEPSVDLSTKVLYLVGLNNYFKPKPGAGPKPVSAGSGPGGGSGPEGALLGGDFRAAYAPNVSMTGAGQTIGLLEFDDYYTNDIAAYEALAGLPTSIVITNDYIDYAPEYPSGDAGYVGEVSLDIEMAISMAPGAQVIVYDAGPYGYADDMLSAMADSGAANQISSSWFFDRDAMTDELFERLAMQSQSFFECSGDDDAYYEGITSAFYPHAGPPADDPYVTSVGGTTLTTSGPGGFWVSETTWNGYNDTTSTNGSGGGVSTDYLIPSWQTNVNMSPNGGSTTMRNIPDVAMAGTSIWVIYDDGYSDWFWGTSCAAPLWAGFTALVNQDAAAHGQPPVGLINQAVYRIGSEPGYTAAFHDITTGNNTNEINPNNQFYACPGYDLCTGWGSPDGMNLIDALAVSDPLVISPNCGFHGGGAAGGPFTPTNEIFTLTNSGSAAVSWSVTSLAPWLTATPASGILPASHGTANISVELTPAANSLPAGLFAGYLILSNLTLNTEQSREVTLQTGLDPITFDDIPSAQGDYLLAGYAGLYWDNFACLNGITNSVNPSGYEAGVISGSNVVYNSAGDPASIIGVTPFDLLSAYLTAAWRDNLQVEAIGYCGNNIMYDTTNTLSATSPKLVTFNYYGVSEVEFITFGGTPHSGYASQHYQLVMDNLLVATHESPILSPELRAAGRMPATNVLSWNAQIGQTYQLQSITNLTGTNWMNAGSPLTAAGAFPTVTNVTAGPQNFYRLKAIY